MSITYLSLNALYARLKIKYLELIKEIDAGGCVITEFDITCHNHDLNEIQKIRDKLNELDENLTSEFKLFFQTRYNLESQKIELCIIDNDNKYILGIKID